MSQIIGYARVSTTDQNLEIQLEQLSAAGCTKIYQEKVSGAKRDRPELEKLLEHIREEDTVVVCKLDRIARSTRHLLEIVDYLKEKGVTFKVLNMNLDTSTATGRLMLELLAAIGQFERSMLLERQAEGIEQAKLKGIYKGRQPTAQKKAGEVKQLLAEGVPKLEIAKRLCIGKSSVYRIAGEKQ
ncbi:MAG: recombinase family protein [Smithellaceae bacterium]